MLTATLKDLWAKKIRLFTTGIAVVLGVAFMSGTLVLTDTVSRTFDDLFANVYKNTDAVVRAKATVTNDFDDLRPRLDDSVVTAVRGVDGVELARGNVFRNGIQIVGKDGKALGRPGMGPPTFGGSWSDDVLNPFRLDEGRAPQLESEAIIDRKSAKDGDLAVGDVTTVLTPTPIKVTIVGIATFGSIDSPGGASYVGMTEGAAQQFFGEPGKFDTIDVVGRDGVSQVDLKARIAKAIDDQTEVITGAEATKEQNDDVQQGIGFFRTALLIFAFVALFVGSFIIYNTFGIIVAQRTKELALFRALGASRTQVLRSVLVEATLIGIAASAIGLGLGIVVSGLLKALLDAADVDVPAGGTVVTAATVAISFIVGTLVTVASAFFPAWRASRVPPLAAMREVAVDRSAASRRRAVTGAVTLVVGILLLANGVIGDAGIGSTGLGILGFIIGVIALGPVLASPIARVLGAPLPRLKGMTGVLARENATRNPKRTAATASALMIGVALVGFITVFASSAKASIYSAVDERFRADLIISSGSFGGSGLPTNVADDARKLPEIASASGVRGAPAVIDGADGFITAVDPTTIDAVYDLQVVAGSLADLGDGTIAVQRRWAESNDKAIGDTIDVQLVQGGVQHLVVKMVYDDQVFVGKYFIPFSVYDKGVVDKQDMLVFLKAKGATSPEDARAAVEALAKPYPTAKVQDLSDFKDAQATQFNVLLALIYGLLLLAIVIALLGIANTLALSVFERTRELGLLRAVGMTRRQTRSSIRWESVMIALLGTVLGLVIGLFFGWMMSFALKDQGFTRFSVPFLQLIVISILAGVAGVIAAIWPARRAARLNVLAAIAAE